MKPRRRGHRPIVRIAGALSVCAALLVAGGFGRTAAAGRATGRSPAKPKPAERLDRPAPAAAKAIRMGPDDLGLEVAVPEGGATDAWLSRFLLSPDRAAAIRRAHGGRLPGPGRPLRIPIAELKSDLRYKVVRELFPEDGPVEGGWRHRVGAARAPEERETLELVARAYTHGPENASRLLTLNPSAPGGLRPGQAIVVPQSLLHPAFARRTKAPLAEGPASVPAAHDSTETLPELRPLDQPVPTTGASAGDAPAATDDPQASSEPEDDFTEAPASPELDEEGQVTPPPAPLARPPVAEGAADLAYGQDETGPYAIYRLKRGEALYSAVVVRFTGRIDVQEVNELSARIAQRSRIADVTNIPIGYRVRIPLDALLPEYLPRDDPKRLAWEREHAEVARYTNMATSRGLEGVAVILDAGHGGRDVGAAHNGIWEHDYVYDILCRIKERLEKESGARVLPIIKDRKEGFVVHESDRLRRSRTEVLLTSPPFPLTERKPSVNLRWYLSNAHYRRLVKEGIDPLKIVFTSLHADARHPSLAGAMVYVPGQEFRRGRYGHSGAVYARYREVREEPYVVFTRDERERSEGLSRQFAAALVDAFGARGVAVHPYQPVRERIIRKGRSWVPAVLRCNIVPVEVLVEVANLSNAPDSRRLADPAYRQKAADAYVDALHAYFSGASPGARAARSGGGR